ncbi:MBL fold metallo-hydrolase [Alcaligenes parafaecalis]|uniref:MBL fold metallo-hydrolase n=1 Tax=Alcaligenes parafaecalis TaxID=171260 RepID=A0ABT3VJ75_9BURK|nr:MBL fold metallo-hydrolase [Alcaligenes parafaecalis]MCX5463547.1 MBL fold metallo-hydrolase [Alcaligenes parafaecalis]
MRIALKALCAGLLFGVAAVSYAGSMTVTLLGTGTPAPYADRAGPATLVQAGEETLLFDTGRGVATRLFQKGVAPNAITAHFFTHLHSDHTVGLPDLWLTGWFGRPWPGRTLPLQVYGPKGTKTMTDYLPKAYDEDIRIRVEDQGLPVEGVKFVTQEFEKGGVLYEKNGVTVTAVEVDHGGELIPAFGFIVEYDGKKVAISGDAMYDKRLIEAAANADVFVHSVALIDPAFLKARPILNETLKHFSTPEQVGQVFAESKPLLGAYTHIVFYSPEGGANIPEQTLLERTRSTYQGPVVAGRDLMEFKIQDKAVIAYDQAGKEMMQTPRQ